MDPLNRVYERMTGYLVELHEAHAALTANASDPGQRVLYAYFLDAVSRAEREIARYAPPGAAGKTQ